MIRLNFALRRLPSLSREEFQHYWRQTHGPLVARVARSLRMRRYVQSHTVEDPLGVALRAVREGMQDPFDGMASVWFDSRDDLIVATTSEEGRQAGALLLEDERRFIDLAHSPLWVCQEIAQINPMPENSIVAAPTSDWIKICYLLNPKAGMSQADFHRTWNMEHGYLIRRLSGRTRFARYIQNHTLDDTLNDQLRATRGGPPPYAGLTEAWFDRSDLETMLADPESEGSKGFAAFLDDEKRFIDFTRSTAWVSKELVLVDDDGS
jgi:uncharacterized protein (TIGR02118 family)